MTRSQASLLSILLPVLLAACQPSAPAADAAATTPAANATAASGPSAEAEAAAASAAAAAGAQPAAATDPAAPADAEKPADPAPEAAADTLRPGVDYAEIQGGQPYEPLAGKIEVVEVFGYVCPACAAFEPSFTAWKARQPADVRVTYVPAPYGPQWIPYARAYYVSESMGLVEKTHTALFHAIHISGALPGEGKQPDEAKVAAWFGQYGADPKRFASEMHSFATEAKIKRGTQFMMRSQVGGTPTLVINGKYRVLGRSYEDMLRIADALIARERGGRGASAP
jgi:thiol:disulfide interchange protein DsbA